MKQQPSKVHPLGLGVKRSRKDSALSGWKRGFRRMFTWGSAEITLKRSHCKWKKSHVREAIAWLVFVSVFLPNVIGIK